MAAEETKAISGDGGKVYVGLVSSPLGGEVAEIGHWTATIARDAIETPKFQTDRTRITGKRDFSGSFDGSWYLQDTNQKVLQDALLGGTTVYLNLLTKTGNTYSCWALITGEAIDVPHDGAISISFDFVSTGKIELTIASTSA